MKLKKKFVSVQNKEISRPKAAGIFLQMIPKAVKTSGIMKAGFFQFFGIFSVIFVFLPQLTESTVLLRGQAHSGP